jgi:hypothetical protein
LPITSDRALVENDRVPTNPGECPSNLTIHGGQEEKSYFLSRLTLHVLCVLRGSPVWNLLLLAQIGLFLFACAYAHPVADDLDFASSARQAGLLTAWRQQYVTWNGRYTSNLLALAIPLAKDTGAGGYRMAVALMLAATVPALYALLRALARDEFTRAEVVTAAFALCALYLCEMPSLGEGIYWYTSAVTYHAAAVLACVHGACVVRSGPGRGVAALLLAIALLVAVAGFNEVVTVMMLAVYGGLVAVTAAREGSGRMAFATLLATAAACAVVVIFAPGNVARLAEYPLRHQLRQSLVMTALQTIRFLSAWIASAPLLAASALWLSHAHRLAALVTRSRARVYLPLCLGGLFLVVPLAAFPAYWATGILGQHRTMNTAYFAFLVLWFAGLALWSVSGSRNADAVQIFAFKFRMPLAWLFLMSVVLTHNSYAVASDLVTGRFAAFDHEMHARDRALRECRAAGARATCEVEPIHTVPASFFMLDIAADSSNWVNVAYARYFGLARVRSMPPDGSPHVRY